MSLQDAGVPETQVDGPEADVVEIVDSQIDGESLTPTEIEEPPPVPEDGNGQDVKELPHVAEAIADEVSEDANALPESSEVGMKPEPSDEKSEEPKVQLSPDSHPRGQENEMDSETKAILRAPTLKFGEASDAESQEQEVKQEQAEGDLADEHPPVENERGGSGHLPEWTALAERVVPPVNTSSANFCPQPGHILDAYERKLLLKADQDGMKWGAGGARPKKGKGKGRGRSAEKGSGRGLGDPRGSAKGPKARSSKARKTEMEEALDAAEDDPDWRFSAETGLWERLASDEEVAECPECWQPSGDEPNSKRKRAEKAATGSKPPPKPEGAAKAKAKAKADAKSKARKETSKGKHAEAKAKPDSQTAKAKAGPKRKTSKPAAKSEPKPKAAPKQSSRKRARSADDLVIPKFKHSALVPYRTRPACGIRFDSTTSSSGYTQAG